MIRSCFVGVALVAMLSAACADNQQGRGNAADRTGSAAGEGGGASGAANPNSPASPGTGTGSNAATQMSSAEQQFVRQAAHSNQMEVEMAEMGQDKAQNEQVKQFAEQLEQDHSRALDDLRSIANRASVRLEEQDDAQRTGMTDKMGNARGLQFDSQFVSQMIDAHRKDIAEFERQQSTATGDVKAFIEKTLPVMREHLQKAEALQKQLGTNTNRGNQ